MSERDNGLSLIDPQHPEAFCGRCHQRNAVWFAPNDLWNKAVPEGGILCPVCFIASAEAVGIRTTWCVMPEERLAAGAAPPTGPLVAILDSGVLPDGRLEDVLPGGKLDATELRPLTPEETEHVLQWQWRNPKTAQSSGMLLLLNAEAYWRLLAAPPRREPPNEATDVERLTRIATDWLAHRGTLHPAKWCRICDDYMGDLRAALRAGEPREEGE